MKSNDGRLPTYLITASLALFFITAIATALTFGTVKVSLGRQWQILWHFLTGSLDFGETDVVILTQFRLPRVVLGALVGFTLAICGTVMQGIFRNPLADPYLLGVSSGATAGAALIISLGLLWIPFALGIGAFVGGVLAVSLVYFIAKSELGYISDYTLILAGVAIGAMFASMTTFLVFIAENQGLRDIFFWIMGSLAVAHWSSLFYLAIFVAIGTYIVVLNARDLDALALGDEMARHLGVQTQRLKKELLLSVTLLTAAVVSLSGTIGFVGLIVPHAMRMFVGPSHRRLLLASGVAGAAFLVLCDTLSRTLVEPLEIPVGVITSMFGAPFFLYILKKHRRDRVLQ